MNILFIGASSFTGYGFVKRILKNKSFKVHCTFTKSLKSYDNIKRKRIDIISKYNNSYLHSNTKFGDKKFLKLLKKKKFSILCFHHAYTKNYNDNKKFNLKKSLKENLYKIDNVFENIYKGSKIIVSNTIFQDIKTKRYLAINAYGKSKTKSYETIKYYCKLKNLEYKSIFITNPWGILEEKKLNYILLKKWLNRETPSIKFSKYIRDNIYIDDLANAYYKILISKSKKIDYFPTGYCSTNKIFIEALRKKFEKFFKIKASIKYIKNIRHEQPIKRINGKTVLNKIVFKENLNNYFRYYFKLLK